MTGLYFSASEEERSSHYFRDTFLPLLGIGASLFSRLGGHGIHYPLLLRRFPERCSFDARFTLPVGKASRVYSLVNICRIDRVLEAQRKYPEVNPG